MTQKNQLICVAGPTASGKTALSVALAEHRDTEIISADSMQIYQGMDIGTAKPTRAERREITHHMLDIIPTGTDFSVAQYVSLADTCAQEILSRGKIPIVAGGTGLYMDALIACNTFSGDETDLALREELNRLAATHGAQYMHDLLREVDQEGAERLHPNNLKRVIRAIEVYRQTGMTLSALNARNRRPTPKYQAAIIGLCPTSREMLYERINKRVDLMLEDGLLGEAERLYKAQKLVGTAGQAIGYKELIAYFEGRETLEACIDLLKQRTRNYAKRQLTWLKKDDRIHWIYYNENTELSALLQNSTEYLESFGVS